jgi:uncharacterized protein (DUF1330 family)
VTVYAIAQLRFTDRPCCDRYQAGFLEVFRRCSGALRVADEAAFPQWSKSPGYQDISQDRRAGADTVVLLSKGLS